MTDRVDAITLLVLSLERAAEDGDVAVTRIVGERNDLKQACEAAIDQAANRGVALRTLLERSLQRAVDSGDHPAVLTVSPRSYNRLLLDFAATCALSGRVPEWTLGHLTSARISFLIKPSENAAAERERAAVTERANASER